MEFKTLDRVGCENCLYLSAGHFEGAKKLHHLTDVQWRNIATKNSNVKMITQCCDSKENYIIPKSFSIIITKPRILRDQRKDYMHYNAIED